ncbi:MAG: leucine-rich repeat domain-containing protein [Sedimentisphaerales bacterium]|nr:leucine-rich repeat domain-containing protein [Sedimentisphaerales bacterium]
MRIASIALVIGCVVACTAHAGAVVLYEQSLNTTTMGFFSYLGHQEGADEFVLPQDATLTAVRWYGYYGYYQSASFQSGGISGAFTIALFSSAGDLPGAEVAQYRVSASRADTGHVTPSYFANPGMKIYEFEADLPSPLAVNAGETLWLSIVADDADTKWLWARHSYSATEKMAHRGPQTDWKPFTTALAFTLLGDFKPIATEHTLVIIAGDGGRVVTPGAIGPGQRKSFSYPHGTVVTLEAQADADYSFNGWAGSAVTAGRVADSTNTSTSVTMDADYTLVANFGGCCESCWWDADLLSKGIPLIAESGETLRVTGSGVGRDAFRLLYKRPGEEEHTIGKCWWDGGCNKIGYVYCSDNKSDPAPDRLCWVTMENWDHASEDIVDGYIDVVVHNYDVCSNKLLVQHKKYYLPIDCSYPIGRWQPHPSDPNSKIWNPCYPQEDCLGYRMPVPGEPSQLYPEGQLGVGGPLGDGSDFWFDTFSLGSNTGGGTPAGDAAASRISTVQIGDLDWDGDCDGADFAVAISALGQSSGEAGYDPLLDLDGDGLVSATDLHIIYGSDWLGVARWELDESVGTTAYDTIGGNDGVVYGEAVWQPTRGADGGALSFDGVDDYIDCGNGVCFDLTNALTVAAWIKTTASDNFQQSIVSKGDTAWRIDRNGSIGTAEFACTGLEAPAGSLFGATEIPAGQWHHVAGVYDGERMYLYVDGVLDASQEAQGFINVNSDPVLIGCLWKGMIDDVRIYSEGLNASEIHDLTQTAEPPDPNQAVYFADPNLQAAVETALGVTEPNASDMLRLDSLSAHADITSLVGLEYATNLRQLDLGDNDITTLDPLAGLVYLEGLDLSINQISDVSPLAGLSELRYLVLSDNEISDISPLSSLTELYHLALRGNPLNEEAYSTYIPLIAANNPGINLYYNRYCTLTISSTEGGNLTVSPGQGEPFTPVADGPYTCLCRETTYFSYQLDDGYRFVGWSGTLVNAGVVDPTSPVAEVPLSQPIIIVPAGAGFTLTANFQRIQPQDCTLTISSSSGGSVTEPGEGIFTYEKGTEVSLLALADSHYEFAYWSGNVGSSSNPLTITMDHDVVIEANFERAPYTLITKVEPEGAGSVTRSPDKTTYDDGEKVTLTATPASRYAFSYWDLGVIRLVGWNPATVTMDKDRTVIAKFEALPYPTYDLTLSSTLGGSVTEPGEGTFPYEKYTDVSLLAVAEPGYMFAAWFNEYEHPFSWDNPLQVTVMYDRSIEALFVEEGTAYTLTIDIVPPEGGTVTRTPDKETYGPFERVGLEVTPAPGYWFDHCSGALCRIQLGTGKVTGSVIMDSDKSVTVTFRPAP